MPCEMNHAAWLNGKTLFSKLMQNFLVDMRQAGKQASSGFLPSDRYFSFFWVVISVMYVVFFILGRFLSDSYQLFFIFTEVWLFNFCVSR